MQLSIIIPVHNRSELLSEAIDSILSQHLESFEIILCDDGSTEDIPAACGGFELPEGQLVFSRTEESHGAQVARNRGLALAQGEYVIFMDSDDAMAGAGPKPLLEAMEKDPDLQYAYGKVVRTDEDLRPLEGDIPVGAEFADQPVEVAGYHWHTMGPVYRRSYLELVGPWNVDMTGSQDWEYQARVKLEGGKRKFVDQVVGYWRQHGGDRVGTAGFRPDYVRSVMIGCESVLGHARERQHCDSALEKRLAKRLVVHALEWGAHKHLQERKECLAQAKASLSSCSLMRCAIICLSLAPSVWDRFLLQRITGRSLG